MKFFDIGGEAHGVIAIGQEATGVIAIGQSATGIVAVGQMARGVVVVGQLAIGFFSVGQLAIGLHTAVGMVGVAGRRGVGAVWKIFPKKEASPAVFVPELVDPAELVEGRRDSGWIEADIEIEGDRIALRAGGRTLEVEMAPSLAAEAKSLSSIGRARVRARLQAEERIVAEASSYRDKAPTERVLRAFEIEPMPIPEHKKPEFWSGLAARGFLFALLCGVYYVTAGADVWNGIAPDEARLPGGLDWL
jgi:hypothetical protein